MEIPILQTLAALPKALVQTITVKSEQLKLSYVILCDDVRLEVGNKLSLMGVFQSMVVEHLPVTVLKFAVVSHWKGAGSYQLEVLIRKPDRQGIAVASSPSTFDVGEAGHMDNVSFFVNTTFNEPGRYWVQIMIDSEVIDQQPLLVFDGQSIIEDRETLSSAIN